MDWNASGIVVVEGAKLQQNVLSRGIDDSPICSRDAVKNLMGKTMYEA
jgi:hypothetical protein